MIKDNAVVYELWYPHPPERVWRALTDPVELAQWLMPSRDAHAQDVSAETSAALAARRLTRPG